MVQLTGDSYAPTRIKTTRVVAIDVGGTKTFGRQYEITRNGRQRQLSFSGNLLHLPTPKEKPRDLANLIAAFARQNHACAIGVSFAGPVTKEGVIEVAPNIWGPKVRNIDFTGMLKKRTGLPISLANDMDRAARRELFDGAASDTDIQNAVVVTVSSGVGGAKIFARKPLFNDQGIKGEIGHQVFDPQSPLQCGCGGNGHIETFASGYAAARYARLFADSGLYRESRFAPKVNSIPLDIKLNIELAQAAKQEDPLALEVVDQVTSVLATGVRGWWELNKLHPQKVIIIGGFAISVGDLFLAELRKHLLAQGQSRDDLSADMLKQMVVFGKEDGFSCLIGAALAAEEVIYGPA